MSFPYYFISCSEASRISLIELIKTFKETLNILSFGKSAIVFSERRIFGGLPLRALE